MLIRREESRTFDIPHCHGGAGAVKCREILGEYDRTRPGFTMVHEDILAPGVSIGEHRHEGDEEIYFILEGSGRMLINGSYEDVEAGDVCVTRDGESHSLINTGDCDMHLIVVASRV